MKRHRCGQKGHWRVGCTEELSGRSHERGHAADVCLMSKEEPALAGSDDDDDDIMIRSRFHLSRTERQASVVMFWAERDKGSRLGR